ncbi:hypothetical protein ASPFODRAFT_390588 [Aspergillus luchuensis CBS 106.47]|uniref:Uncharacterized protein n=1 Tax=Aspergillus luchuensis (strain CBS 106.47) TaxID=1137211 RepID=A0A1M3T3K3_ASPLC|nr:hypothetical protein ASPFODRAFT_390588 [Aspergillus luchuensis CBS 106.47]
MIQATFRLCLLLVYTIVTWRGMSPYTGVEPDAMTAYAPGSVPSEDSLSRSPDSTIHCPIDITIHNLLTPDSNEGKMWITRCRTVSWYLVKETNAGSANSGFMNLSDRAYRSVCSGRRNLSFPVYGACSFLSVSDDRRCRVVQVYLCFD